MLKIIALDPEVITQWDHFVSLREAFGISEGKCKLIAKFPRDWKRLVRERIATLVANGVLSPAKGKVIEDWMTPPRQMQRDPRFVEGCSTYSDELSWSENAEIQASTFDVVLCARPLNAPNAFLADDVHEYVNHPLWPRATPHSVHRNSKSLVDCVSLIIRQAREVKLIEPHFDPTLERFTRTLQHLCRRIHLEPPRLSRFELHVCRSEEFGRATIQNYRSHLERILPNGLELVVCFWPPKHCHARFLLTDSGSMQTDHGWDEDEGQGPPETIVRLLPEDGATQEWERFNSNRRIQDFDPERHVLRLANNEP